MPPLAPSAIVPAQPEGADPASGVTPQQMASWVLIVAAIVLLTWVFMRLQWRRQRRGEEQDPVHQMRETIADRQAESERASEATGSVRDMAARLETKAARLEALLDQADERIARLEEHEARLEERVAAAPVERSIAGSRPALQGVAEHDAGPNAPATAEPQPDPWTETGSSPQQATHANGSADPLHQEVYELADGGKSPLDIARRLDQQVGTIELILALRR